MKITSTVFEENKMIPKDATCDGADRSPPLKWSWGPEGTESFALIVDDPDAPSGVFTHWVLFNLPARVTHLDENQPHSAALANGAVQGINDFGKLGYGGPCPPRGTHRYFFNLYALDGMLRLGEGTTKQELLKAMEGHVLAESLLVGKYARSGEVNEEEESEENRNERCVDESSEESFPASDPPSWNP